MKKNVNQKLALAAAVVTLLNFTSCGKYDEGPGFSLRSKTARLTNGEWELDDLDGDGNDFADMVEEMDAEVTCEFEKGGDFSMEMKGEDSYSYYGYNIEVEYDGKAKGEWEWASGKESVDISFDDEKMDLDITLSIEGYGSYSYSYEMEMEDTEFEILRLTNKELKFEDEDGNEWTCKRGGSDD